MSYEQIQTQVLNGVLHTYIHIHTMDTYLHIQQKMNGDREP